MNVIARRLLHTHVKNSDGLLNKHGQLCSTISRHLQFSRKRILCNKCSLNHRRLINTKPYSRKITTISM